MKQNIPFYLVSVIILLIILLIIVKNNIFEKFNNSYIDSELIPSEMNSEMNSEMDIEIDNDKQELVKMLNSVTNENNKLKQRISSLSNKIKKNSNKVQLCDRVSSLSDYQTAYGERKHIIDKLKSGFAELIEDNQDLDDQNNDLLLVHKNKQLANASNYGSAIPTTFV